MTTARVRVVLGTDKKEIKRQKGWRIEASLVDYLEKRGRVSGEVNVVEDCIRLHRTLSDVLSSHGSRLEAYAAENALTLRDHESAIIARLVLLGLEAHEKRRK